MRPATLTHSTKERVDGQLEFIKSYHQQSRLKKKFPRTTSQNSGQVKCPVCVWFAYICCPQNKQQIAYISHHKHTHTHTYKKITLKNCTIIFSCQKFSVFFFLLLVTFYIFFQFLCNSHCQKKKKLFVFILFILE